MLSRDKRSSSTPAAWHDLPHNPWDPSLLVFLPLVPALLLSLQSYAVISDWARQWNRVFSKALIFSAHNLLLAWLFMLCCSAVVLRECTSVRRQRKALRFSVVAWNDLVARKLRVNLTLTSISRGIQALKHG